MRNYFVPFLGAKTDAKSIPMRKWSEWETWRRQNVRRGGAPKADTLLNEMGHIRECWKWGMEQGQIPFAPVLPFNDENLVTDDKVRRDTWELDEWNRFKSRPAKWLREQESKREDEYWDCFVAYQMLFFLSNNGMRVGEVVKVRRKGIRFYERELGDRTNSFKRLGALVQVHQSTKTGAREVNSMGGEFAMRVYEKASHKRKDDFLLQHLNGNGVFDLLKWIHGHDTDLTASFPNSSRIFCLTHAEREIQIRFVPSLSISSNCVSSLPKETGISVLLLIVYSLVEIVRCVFNGLSLSLFM